MTYPELSQEEKQNIINMYNDGIYDKDIALKFDTTRRTVTRWREKIKYEFSINLSDESFLIKGKSTLYNEKGEVKQEWVKTDKVKEDQFNAMKEAIHSLTSTINPTKQNINIPANLSTDLLNTYISNDVHFGAFMNSDETRDRDWNLNIAETTMKASYDFLIDNSPNTHSCIVLDLGDLTEPDNFSNMTPKSGHVLSVDGRFQQIFRTAYMSLIYGIEKALTKHEVVYFINIAGNHDMTTGVMTREVIRAWYKNEPRVIVDDAPSNIKYFQHSKTLLQFAHGDMMRMEAAGEVMAVDKRDILHQCDYRYSLFGHNHKNKVVEGRLTSAESFRNLSPLNDWASNMGFRGGCGTMNCITYSSKFGEVARTKFNVNMIEE